MPELEIDTVASMLTLDARAPVGRVVLQDQLLEVEERPLVVDSLADLHLRLPEVRRVHALTVLALQVLNDELDDERLLHLGAIQHLLLDGQLDLQPL